MASKILVLIFFFSFTAHSEEWVIRRMESEGTQSTYCFKNFSTFGSFSPKSACERETKKLNDPQNNWGSQPSALNNYTKVFFACFEITSETPDSAAVIEKSKKELVAGNYGTICEDDENFQDRLPRPTDEVIISR